MTVLSRLLNKLKAQPKTLEEQLAELDQLPIEELDTVALEDERDVFRLAAIARLDYGATLIKLAYDSGVSSVQQKARQRLAELADQGAISLDQLAADGVDALSQFAVVGLCKRDDLLEQLLNSNSDEVFFYQIALEGVSTKLRQLAAEKIEDEERLKLLLKNAKGKDKGVYKIVKAKCDGFRDRDQLAAQTQVELVSLCERLVAHSKRPFDKSFTAQNQHLQEQWALLLAQAHEPLVARARQATLECQETIDTFLKQQADVKAQELAIAKAAQQQAEIIDKLRAALAHLFDCLSTEEERQSTGALLEECREQWLGAIEYLSARDADEKAFRQLGDGIEFQLQQLQQHGSLIDQVAGISGLQAAIPAEPDIDRVNVDAEAPNTSGYADLLARTKTASLLAKDLHPQPLLDALALMSEREKQGAEKKQAEKNQLRQLNALIRKAQSATESGQSLSAVGIRRTIEEKRSQLKAMPAHLSKQLEQLDAALEKLLDWKDYVVEPKKQQLVEQMRALVDSRENPEALATKIRRLQNEWKGLSKGAQDQDLWETFHQLAQQAYKPCKVFFDQQAKIRSDNLEKRIQMVAQLENYLSAQPGGEEEPESIDCSAVEKLLTVAIKEWRSYAPVERTASKPAQQGFDRVLDAIRAKLNEQYQKNADKKRQFIDQVLKLVAQEDNHSAVEEVKRLQAQWKLIGSALRKDEQILWKSFRKGCDAIFEKRQQKTEEFKAELDVNKNAALALLHEVESLLELSGKALMDARARVAECQEEYKAVGSLPKAKENSLNQAFYKSIELFERRVSLQLTAAKEQVWLDYLTAADKIRLYQIAESAATAVVLEQEARAYIASVEQWPKNGLASLEQKMEQGAGDATQEDNEQTLKRFCIRAEILSDLPTPDEDKSLRMQYQMSRLEQGLGQAMPDKSVEMNTMIFEWVAVGPVSTVIYQSLLERFQQCR
jgi:exonuclease SbcC